MAAKACYRVGLLLDEGVHLGDYYHGALLHGLRQAACADDPGVELFIQRQNSPAAIPNLLADGFICFHPFRETFAMLEAVAKSTPIVVLGGSSRDTSLHCVDSENEGGAREAVRHLAQLGIATSPSSMVASPRPTRCIVSTDTWRRCASASCRFATSTF